ncbi:hypothetical protein OROMI_010797 [Orobanche minor]
MIVKERMGHKLVNLIFILTLFVSVAHSSRLGLNPSTIKTSLKDAEVEGFGGDDEEAKCEGIADKVEECLGRRTTTMAAAAHLDYIYT